MEMHSHDEIRAQVRTAYSNVAKGQDGCSVGCCGSRNGASRKLGYTDEDLAAVPAGADLGTHKRLQPCTRGRPCSTSAAVRALTACWRPNG